MNYIVVAAASILAAANWTDNFVGSVANGKQIVNLEITEHGGGCRKSSPPGQCCHMDNKAGSVHCH
jgi:hypothetical protein